MKSPRLRQYKSNRIPPKLNPGLGLRVRDDYSMFIVHEAYLVQDREGKKDGRKFGLDKWTPEVGDN